LDRTTYACQQAMDHAVDYADWREAAEELDRRNGLDEWKDDEISDDYDWRLIRSRLRQLRQFRAERDVRRIIHHLRQGLHWNLGNIGNPALYSVARVGTKRLIHDYIEEVVAVLHELCEGEFEGFTSLEKLKFFHEVSLSYGRSALMLSGGATLGLFHVGVVKALYREGVLPNVLSGSSAGSVVAATVGTRAPDEMDELLHPESAYYHFWRALPLRSMWAKRSIMDQTQVRKAIARNVRDLTFEESYQISGKVVNITVSPAGSNQPPRLLNYLTFPYLYLREAVLASCAVPLLFPPVMLMTQDESRQRVPFMPLLKWNDGSLKSDLPIMRMRRLHNVNHFVVSQTNPHVIPFMTHKGPQEEGGLWHSARRFAYSTVRHQAKNVLDLVRGSLPMGAMQRQLEAASSILAQEYRGNVTVFPQRSLWRFMRVTANPNLHDVQRFILEGERATWQRVSQIRNQVLISQTLDHCVDKLEKLYLSADRRQLPAKPGLRVVRSR
jgi:TAG lipase / steryl ester hydrolase / phospholipase A2 / LPA acyltransferase